jgi:hypothetical protein
MWERNQRFRKENTLGALYPHIDFSSGDVPSQHHRKESALARYQGTPISVVTNVTGRTRLPRRQQPMTVKLPPTWVKDPVELRAHIDQCEPAPGIPTGLDLATLRTSAGISLQTAAAAAGVSSSSIFRCEAGTVNESRSLMSSRRFRQLVALMAAIEAGEVR